MTTASLIFILIFITACNSFEHSVNNDPRYSSVIDYETKKPIKPVIIHYDDYTFVTGFSDTAATLGMYYKTKEIRT